MKTFVPLPIPWMSWGWSVKGSVNPGHIHSPQVVTEGMVPWDLMGNVSIMTSYHPRILLLFPESWFQLLTRIQLYHLLFSSQFASSLSLSLLKVSLSLSWVPHWLFPLAEDKTDTTTIYSSRVTEVCDRTTVTTNELWKNNAKEFFLSSLFSLFLPILVGERERKNKSEGKESRRKENCNDGKSASEKGRRTLLLWPTFFWKCCSDMKEHSLYLHFLSLLSSFDFFPFQEIEKESNGGRKQENGMSDPL